MILLIDTTKKHSIEIILKDDNKIIARKQFDAEYSQTEKLLPAIDKIFKQNNCVLKDLKEIKVNNNARKQGTSFTALRIGVATANALAYALDAIINKKSIIKNKSFNIVEPVYSKEPNITS